MNGGDSDNLHTYNGPLASRSTMTLTSSDTTQEAIDHGHFGLKDGLFARVILLSNYLLPTIV